MVWVVSLLFSIVSAAETRLGLGIEDMVPAVEIVVQLRS
jgi:hypothetical protein